jgi:CNT family concentrative nucleoside transporter
MGIYNLISFIGVFLLMGLAYLCSSNKKVLNWRVIVWGLLLQFIFAVFIFILPVGGKIFLVVNQVVVKILDSASAGSEFLFGRLALPPGMTNDSGETSLGFFLAFQALPAVIFFSALMGMLYHFKVMPFMIQIFARIFTRLMQLSGAESLCASSNIFVGIESALTIRPLISKMTRSELHTILTAGMATIASSVLALYVYVLYEQFPTIAGHLVSASLLSAPAALIMSKLIIPELDQPETLGIQVKPTYQKYDNMIEAIINGANTGVKLVVGIAGLLLAFLGIVALFDLILMEGGNLINQMTGLRFEWNLKVLLGYLFYPVSLAMGVHPEDAFKVAQLIGERLIVTEVTAYQDLAVLIKGNVISHARSVVICTYALCGFAHVASLAIFVGGISSLAPDKTKELSRLGPRALLAATFACLMTGAVAGTFYISNSILIGP